MNYLRIYDLTDQATVSIDWRVAIDDGTFTDAQSCTIEHLLEPEATIREANDDEIAASTGLNTNYTYKPLTASNYIRPIDFANAGLTPNTNNACSLLDAKIYALSNRLFLELIVNLSNDELLHLNYSPKVIYSAFPGFFVNPVDIVGKIDYATAAFVTSSDNVLITVDGVTIAHLPYQMFESVVDNIYKGTIEKDIVIKDNTAIILTTAADYTGGGGTARVRMLFELVNANLTTIVPSSGCCNNPISGVFTSGDIVADKLVLTHNTGTENVMGVAITDDLGNVTMYYFKLGDAAGADTSNKITLDFKGITITNTWSFYFITFVA